MTRKTTSTTPDAFDALREQKREGESWSDLFHRAADALSGDEESGDGDDEHGPNTSDGVTQGDLEDFQTALVRDVADAVENRLTGR